MNSLRHAVGVLLAALIALGGATLLLTLQIARRVVTPVARHSDSVILGVDTGAQTIELARTADSVLPGRYGLFTTGTHGYVKLGAVLGTEATHVRRKLLTKIETGARIDRDASFSGWYYTSPSELHLPWESVLIGSPAGPCPAWLFPAGSSTWVIQIHGRGATRAECLRAVPIFHARDMPTLVVSYRNDGEAPRSRAGAYALGASEWRDVEAAIAYALRHGATRVLLMGWSMGGAIALQSAVSSARRDAIAGVILESPVVDWRTVLHFQAGQSRIKPPLPALAMRLLSSPVMSRWAGAERPIPFDQLDMVARSQELSTPILLLHSHDDGFVPPDASYALAEARPDLVTLARFERARHTKIWNYDEHGFTGAIEQWLDRQGFGGVAEPGDGGSATAVDADG